MLRLASGGGFSCEMVSDSESEIVLRIAGNRAADLFRNEAGGHRWQRVPPTEQNGRRHSSTFTVAVFIGSESKAEFDESEIEFEATIGHGPGGQHRNKTATAIRATHKPTGIVVFIQSERSQQANKQRAIDTILDRVLEIRSGESHGRQNDTRKVQIGSGERSDKVRTVQEQNDRVIDHRSGKKCNVAAYLKGEIWRLN
jgi:peptide chain release factor 1